MKQLSFFDEPEERHIFDISSNRKHICTDISADLETALAHASLVYGVAQHDLQISYNKPYLDDLREVHNGKCSSCERSLFKLPNFYFDEKQVFFCAGCGYLATE